MEDKLMGMAREAHFLALDLEALMKYIEGNSLTDAEIQLLSLTAGRLSVVKNLLHEIYGKMGWATHNHGLFQGPSVSGEQLQARLETIQNQGIELEGYRNFFMKMKELLPGS